MMETRDPAIKLFGKTISVPDFPLITSPTLDPSSSSSSSSSAHVDDSLIFPLSSSSPDGVRSRNDFEVLKEQEEGECRMVGDGQHQHHLYAGNAADSAMGATTNKKHSLRTSSPTATEPAEASTSHEKTLKKPDRVLPCPRCNSMDTKFCYYNNYNVNQPRHFCKNCQRYWTAGGTMRNVPIGAGRRKNKTYTSQFRHITISDGFQPTHNDPNNLHSSIPNGSVADRTGLVLAFGPETSLCDSVHSGHDRAEPPGFAYGPEDSKCSVPCQDGDQICDPKVAEAVKNGSFPIQMPCFVSTNPWHYPWSHWRSSVDSMPLTLHPNALYWDASVGNWNVNLPYISLPSCEKQTLSSSALDRHGMEASNPTEISDQLLRISKKMKMGECTTHGGICNRECECIVKEGVSSAVSQGKQGAFSQVIGYSGNS